MTNKILQACPVVFHRCEVNGWQMARKYWIEMAAVVHPDTPLHTPGRNGWNRSYVHAVFAYQVATVCGLLWRLYANCFMNFLSARRTLSFPSLAVSIVDFNGLAFLHQLTHFRFCYSTGGPLQLATKPIGHQLTLNRHYQPTIYCAEDEVSENRLDQCGRHAEDG